MPRDAGHGLSTQEEIAQWKVKFEREGLGESITSHTAVLNACAQEGLAGKAAELLTMMKVKGLQVDVGCYNAVLDAHAKSGDVSGAEQWMQNMR